MSYLIAFLVVLGVNLLPAFGPPTWSVLVLYRLRSDLNPVALVALGAVAAATGRLCLGSAMHRLRRRLPARRRESLDALAGALEERKHASAIGLGLFALSPVPSAQLFEAAGLAGTPLVPLVIAFFAGRIVSYTIYMAGASAVKQTSMGDLLRSSITSPGGIAIQIAFLLVVVAIGRIDWQKHLRRRPARDGAGDGN